MTDLNPETTHYSQERPPLWRDATILKWVIQVLVLVLVVSAIFFMAAVAGDNLSAKNIPIDYDFVSDPPGISIGEGIDTSPSTGGRALWVAMVNTFRIAGAGILAATALGLVVGLARLSDNWMARKAASAFIETLRNIPVLVQIIFWFVIIGGLPQLERKGDGTEAEIGWFMTSQKGISLPRVFLSDGFYQWFAMLVPVAVGAWFVRRRLIHKRELEGGETYPTLIFSAIMVVAAAIAWFINPAMAFLGPIFQAISDGIDSIPQAVAQLILSVLSVALAANWIRNFLDKRRTPAGLAKLSDDDIFSMIFAGLAAVIAVVLFWRLWPGLSDWILNSSRDLFGVLADKFGGERGSKPIDAMRPTIAAGRFANYGPTGLSMSQNMAALFFGLVLYTASFIAEIIRGGILAVAKGQTEAAAALGLSRAQALRRVVLPQAFRVIMPPLGNQYLNITKNTSLGLAVGYADLVSVGQTLYNQTGKTLPVVSIWMIFYLMCSLTISVIVNTINRRLAIVER